MDKSIAGTIPDNIKRLKEGSSRKQDESLRPASYGNRQVYCYVALCAGLHRLAIELAGQNPVPENRQIAKLGTTDTGDIVTRLAEIGADRYGAATRTSKGALIVEPGFENWVAGMILPTRAPTDNAIELLPRAIVARLPSGLTNRRFDLELHHALSPRALRSHQSRSDRMTVYRIGTAERISKARELFFYAHRARADADFLLGAVETVLRQHRQATQT